MSKTGRDWKAIREHYQRAVEAYNAPPTISEGAFTCPRDGYDMRERPGTMEAVCCYCGHRISYDEALSYHLGSEDFYAPL